ncbi:MAG: 50S ribosomal protein L29 [archaeon]
MAILKSKDIAKMSDKELGEKIKDLRTELMKEKVNLAKGGKIKIREIKKTIARLHTFNRLNNKKSAEDLKTKKK